MHHDTQLQRLAEETKGPNKVIERLKRWRWFALFVVAPSLLAIIYFGLIASDVYVSESRFIIKSPDRKQTSMSSLAGLIQTTGISPGQEQTKEIMDYLRSRDALRDLSKRADVRAAFMSSEADRLSRFPLLFHKDTFEHLYDYYGSMVDTRLDHETGMAVLTVNAFEPTQAQVLNENLLQLSEALVNRLNERANTKTIQEAEGRVATAEARVRKARAELARYRNRSQLLDPQQQGIGVLEVSNGLVAQEAALRAKLTEVQRATPNHPSIPALRQRISALSEQIAAQTGRAVGTPTGIASKLSGYENLVVEQEFSTQMLAAANATLEQARTEALKQQYYLERVVEANRPDDALLPARIKGILTVAFASLCLYLIGWMLVVGILEHAPED
ncbi:capsule biosynthesis protein [Sphingobium sp. Ndbn-10]|uniref:capsule biosynthesis protein n=1 Tax=Sphingobium sp. Ndbn-10 TaxID=1667223 RepID=UPI000818B4FF|nr:capsule biosynthesis protein [Sphingobium sp. Ndbn-10]